MPKKTLISNFNAVEINHALRFDKKTFKDFFSNLAESLSIKLPNAPNKYNIESVFPYYSEFIIEISFHLSDASEEEAFKIMQNIDISKAAGMDDLSGEFLKDGVEILAKPLSEICNLSILELFQMPVKLRSSNLFLRKAKKLTHLTTDLFLYYH